MALNPPKLRLHKSPLFWILLLAAACYLPLIVPQWSRRAEWDSAYYVSLARALVRGDGYTYMGEPHTKYPPGLPLILAAVELPFGDNFRLMHALMVLHALGAVALTWLLIRARAPASIATATTVLTAAAYGLYQEAALIVSDVPYTFYALATLYAADRLTRLSTNDSASRSDPRLLAVVCVLIVWTYCVRVIGFVLAPAIALSLCLAPSRESLPRRLKHAVAVLAAIALAMGLWMGRGAWIKNQNPPEYPFVSTYESELWLVNPADPDSKRVNLQALASRISSNNEYYRTMLVDLLTAQTGGNHAAVHWTLGLLLLAGWCFALARRRAATEFYILFYICIILLWPSQQGKRFLLPILPLAFYYCLVPLQWIAEKWEHRTKNAPLAAWLAVGVLCIFSVAANARLNIPFAREQHADPYHPPEVRSYLDALEWVRANTPPDAVLVTDRSPLAYAVTGRRAYTAPWVDDQRRVLQFMDWRGVDIVIANDFGYAKQYLRPVIEAHPHRFREIHRTENDAIYAMHE